MSLILAIVLSDTAWYDRWQASWKQATCADPQDSDMPNGTSLHPPFAKYLD
ncbi:hypothetical protein [Thermocoleostomius sinensis]|uniref:Uncharacterized protein n=1 Tax=Thermocoleostomius sinensis A174 TaxID=2016057 RepID=A0A9E9C5T6_9CYAN|nr:hypothetical protein [Thermocoleostomius sinensis]WAL61516.1 hypothetical protein OXH18_05875 [Thermocoleostomius sinensis A174]